MTFSCDALLFDLDGTLLDSKAVMERHWRGWAIRNGLDPDVIVRYAHGRRPVETMRVYTPHLDVEAEALALATAEAADTDGLRAFDGVANLLARLPDTAWAIVTSSDRATARTRLGFIGLPLPRILVSADDVTLGKPHPTPYLDAARLLGVEPTRCVVVEDTPAGIAAGRAAGMPVVGVVTTHERELLHDASCVLDRIADLQVAVLPDGTLQVEAVGC